MGARSGRARILPPILNGQGVAFIGVAATGAGANPADAPVVADDAGTVDAAGTGAGAETEEEDCETLTATEVPEMDGDGDDGTMPAWLSKACSTSFTILQVELDFQCLEP